MRNHRLIDLLSGVKFRLRRGQGTPDRLTGREGERMLDGISGAHERALVGREQARSGKVIPLDDL
jgi:hypothetical protein